MASIPLPLITNKKVLLCSILNISKDELISTRSYDESIINDTAYS